MHRRLFLKSVLTAISGLSALALANKTANATTDEPSAENRETLLQTSPLAGFQFYDGERLWPVMRPNDPLQLVAEPDNPYDEQAVKVMWNGDQLGYVPRDDNTAVSQMLLRGQMLVARIVELRESTNSWERLVISIYVVHNRNYGGHTQAGFRSV